MTWLEPTYWTYAGSGCTGDGTYRSFLKFSLATPNTPQQLYDGRATLNLYRYPTLDHWWQGGATGNPYYIKQVTSLWSETTVTWNTQPTTTTTGQITVPSSINHSIVNSHNNVSLIVNDWVCGITPNYGFGIQLVNETQLYATWKFASKEHATSSVHPTLSMEYATISASAIDTICSGGSIPLLSCSLTNAAVPSGYNFLWHHLNSGTNYATQNVINPLYSQGLNTYVVTVTNQYCQTGYDTVLVYVKPSVATTQNQTICSGVFYTLPGGAAVNTAGVYIDTLVSLSGCDSIITTHLTVNPVLTSNQNPSICVGSSYVLPSGAIVTTSGVYVDTLLSANGCDSIITSNLTVNSVLTSNQNPAICSNESFILPSGMATNTAGIYIDTLMTTSGCDSVITTTLVVNSFPAISLSSDTTIAPGGSVTIIASGGGTYNWFSLGDLNTTTGDTISVNPSVTTIYCVVVNSNNCRDTACVTVTVEEMPCLSLERYETPNAFSPNMDGVNDEFCIQGWDACIEKFSVCIYNRWGEKVFESMDPNFCWDGTREGKSMDAAVFAYYIKAVYFHKKEVVFKSGNISLLR